MIAYHGGGHRLLRGGGLAYDNDRVVFVSGAYTGPSDHQIDATGKLVISGLVDLHCHATTEAAAGPSPMPAGATLSHRLPQLPDRRPAARPAEGGGAHQRARAGLHGAEQPDGYRPAKFDSVQDERRSHSGRASAGPCGRMLRDHPDARDPRQEEHEAVDFQLAAMGIADGPAATALLAPPDIRMVRTPSSKVPPARPTSGPPCGPPEGTAVGSGLPLRGILGLAPERTRRRIRSREDCSRRMAAATVHQSPSSRSWTAPSWRGHLLLRCRAADHWTMRTVWPEIRVFGPRWPRLARDRALLRNGRPTDSAVPHAHQHHGRRRHGPDAGVVTVA